MKIKKTYQGAIPLNRIANEHNESEMNVYSANYINDVLDTTVKYQLVTTTSTDLNDYCTSGYYSFSSACAPANRPIGTNGYLCVMATTPNKGFIKQIWSRAGTIGTNDYQTYMRTIYIDDDNNKQVGPWYEMISRNLLNEAIEEALNARSYTVGTYNLAYKVAPGFLSNGATEIIIHYHLDKPMRNVNAVSLNNLDIVVRGISGYAVARTQDMTGWSISIVDDSTLAFRRGFDAAISVTNNTPVTAVIYSGTKVTFS